jgi:carboxyl-terminal processing protease
MYKTKSRFMVLVSVCVFLFVVLTGPLAYGKKPPHMLDQTTRLAALAKVWGLLKYYHPEVAKGQIDWDAALISAIPAVKAAVDFDSFNQEIDALIREAGDVDPADYNPGTPAHPNESLFKWIKNRRIFNKDVSKKLKIVQKKHIPADNFYVQSDPNVGNTLFENENPYLQPYYPDENFRLLALFRYWNIIQYFYPYKDDMDTDWEVIVEEFIPRLIAAGDMYEYHLTMKELFTRLNDSHAFSYSPPLNYYFGYYYAPFEVRYFQGKTIVTRVFAELLDQADAVQVGDIVVQRNGTDIDTFRDDMRKYVEASNEPTLERNINDYYVVRGQSDHLTFTLSRDGQVRDVTVPAYYSSIVWDAEQNADSLLDKWKILPGNIGYVHMGIVYPEDVEQVMAELMNTRAIIFDVRYTPNSTFYLFANYLNPEPVDFFKFTYPILDYPGTFDSLPGYRVGPESNPDYYKGRVVFLADERTQSHAEFTCMSLQASPDATFVGSQTAGADGNVSYVWLPGYIVTYFTGLGIYYPDGTPTQRIGIVPDIVSRPTVAGIQQGRDEVLETAIQFIENN